MQAAQRVFSKGPSLNSKGGIIFSKLHDDVSSFLSLRVHLVQKTGELSQNCTSTFVIKFSFARRHVLHLLLSIFEQTPLLRALLCTILDSALRHVPIKTVSRIIVLMTFALHYKFLQQQADVYSRCMRLRVCVLTACIMSQKPWRARTWEHLAMRVSREQSELLCVRLKKRG